MTVSEYIFDFLEKKGVDTVYMVSGSSAMWLTDALKRNERLQAVCCQHEQVAAMAADVYGRTSGIPGVCLVTIGPGATNAITGVAGAYTDSSPMFVLSGQASSKIMQYQLDSGIRQKGTQSLVLNEMVSGITKYFAVLMNEEETRYHVEKAWYEAMNGRKGPVWLDVPVDIQNRQVPEEMSGFYLEEKGSYDSFPKSELRELLQDAAKPLLMVGGGVLSAGVEARIQKFARKYRIPVVASRGGIGAISSEEPLFIGRPGSYGDRASHFAIQECDLILILGSRLSVSTTGYYPDHFALHAKKVLVDIDPKEIEKRDVPIDLPLHMDLSDFMGGIEKVAESISMQDHEAWIQHCMENRDKYPVVHPEYEKEEGINSYFFTKKLAEAAPADATVVVDTGSVCNIVSQSWILKNQQRYVISGGLSCMGFWAGSIGAVHGRKDSGCVIALAGDGSTQMNVQDFATLQYYKHPIKLFIYNNCGYMLIRHNQHNYMNDRFLGVGPDSGVPSVDFSKVAEAYGLAHVKIETKEEINEKISEVFTINGPVVCEVMVQEFGIIAPRIASKVMPDGSLRAAEFDDLWPFLE